VVPDRTSTGRSKMRKRLYVTMTIAAAALLVAAPVGTAASHATTVKVTAGKPAELRFTVSKKAAAKGVVTFKVTNRGALVHDFKIKGKVTKELRPGQTATLKIAFTKPGKYPYLCTLPGHAAAGMKGVFVVK
jgi:uncharacterized cupredoxin-like copper-binding protein